jgi:hypothetical protein
VYAVEGRRADLGEVARLDGYVRYVDGQDVSDHGDSFELLPGCHVIGTPSTWGKSNEPASGAVLITTGKLTFALPMKAGHHYSVDLEVPFATGPSAPVSIKARERDLSGRITRIFERATSERDIHSCEDEATADPRP